jgi:hypothetical protein
MEHPVAGLQSRRGIPKTTPLLHGGTSLKLSDAGPSPVLEAHPGSPVDLTAARRPSLAASLASARSHASSSDVSRIRRSPKQIGKTEESFRRNGVAAKELIPPEKEDDGGESLRPPRRPHVAGMQPFYIPAKVPENEEVRISTTSLHGDDVMSIHTTTDGSEMDFQFETDGGTWITANPLAQESRSSLATTTTAASTLIDDKSSHGALTIDTSVASSAASMMSSSASIYSASTNMSDIYGWEEELDRKSSTENHHAWEQDMSRRLPSGGRTFGPRIRSGYELQYKREDGRRKGLLYRVLNLSGRRGSEDSTGSITPSEAFPTTSA